MLKPRKKITKKEIKKDPVLERVATTYGFFQKKQKLLTRLGIGTVACVFLLFVWNNHKEKTEKDSSSLMTKALVAWQTGDIDNAQLHFESLADEYKGTQNGKSALYWLGVIDYDSGEKDSAKSYLIQFVKKSSIDILLPNAYNLLANISLEENEIDDAHSYFKKSVKYGSLNYTTELYKLNLAEFYLSQDKRDEAEQIITSVLDSKDQSSAIKNKAEELAGRMKS